MRAEIEWNDEALRDIGRRAAEGFAHATRLTATFLWGEVRKEAPVDHGRLAGSFQLSGGGLLYLIYSAVAYALVVHTGSKPHVIEPRNKSVLRFEVGGEIVFARRVHHPGTEANPYITRAIDATVKRREEFVRMGLEQAGLL